MRKAKQIKPEDKEMPERVPPSLTAAIVAVQLYDLERVRRSLNQIDNSIGSYKRSTKEYIAKRREAQEIAEGLARNEATVKETAKEVAEKQLRLLAKHRGVHKVSSNGNGEIVIETPMLFANIRKIAGSKETTRSCIGAFDVRINVRRDPASGCRLSIRNKVFDPNSNGYGHWAIKRSIPCLGEYEADIHKMLDRGDYYAVFDSMYHYLTIADLDASAWLRAHNWRDSYRHTTSLREVRHDTGSYVMVIRESGNDDDESDDDHAFLGRVAKVIRGGQQGSDIMLEFRGAVFHPDHYMGVPEDEIPEEHKRFWLPATYCMQISEDMYKRRRSYSTRSLGLRSEIEVLDKLPDGIPYAIAMDEVKAKVRVRIPLTEVATFTA